MRFGRKNEREKILKRALEIYLWRKTRKRKLHSLQPTQTSLVAINANFTRRSQVYGLAMNNSIWSFMFYILYNIMHCIFDLIEFVN